MIIGKQNRYLMIPVRKTAEERLLYFYSNGVLLRDIRVRVDLEQPEYTAYYDMQSFMGMDITVYCEAGVFKTTDHIGYNEECLRPFFHFTPQTGWMNDPNGLIYYENRYHLFFQHNPVGAVRGSEHWGHAVSKDLIHWEEWELALFPDDMGTMFSGSAIEDSGNVLGMKTNEHNPLVLFYTASGGERSETAKGKPFTQCIAVSTDGGHTFQKWKNNPVIGQITERTRDPKVVYDACSKLFIMALFIDRDSSSNYGFFTSPNLVDWKKIGEICIPGERECPDIYTLTDNGKTKWVFSGSNNFYVTGELDLEKGLIHLSRPEKYGFGSLYAGQTFYGCAQCIRIAWVRYSKAPIVSWASSPVIPTKTHSQFMSVPACIDLRNGRLQVSPAICFEKEVAFENLWADRQTFSLRKEPLCLHLKTNGPVAWLEISLFGNKITLRDGHVAFCDLTGEAHEMPYAGALHIFADSLGYDIFSSDVCYASYPAISNFDQNCLELSGKCVIERLEWGYFPG